MPMDTAFLPLNTPAGRFALRLAAWSLALFGFFRAPWVDTIAILPLTRLQGQLGAALFGAPAAPIIVTSACSGADAFALCIGTICAYPAPWTRRLWGAAGGVALILALNTMRIGTLGRAAASPFWFPALHLYIWPSVLLLAIAVYVFAWMWTAGGVTAEGRLCDAPSRRPARLGVHARFAVITGVLLAAFTAWSWMFLDSAAVLAASAFVTRAAARVLQALGVQAHAFGNVLATGRGHFAVTSECISTPLIPVYLAAIVVYAESWRARLLGFVAAGPIFIALGIARLLVVALPASLVDSPMFLVHAFYQLLLAVALVCGAARWRHGGTVKAVRRAGVGLALGTATGLALSPLYLGTLHPASTTAASAIDPQGALLLLPGFQMGLYVALAVSALTLPSWRPVLAGFVAILALQAIGFALLHLAAPHGWVPEVRDVRAWAVVVPLLAVLVLGTHERPRR